MIIENGRLRAEIAAKGAELIALTEKATGRELLWSGDARYWGRVSPVLFPNVGRTYGDVLRVKGTQYPTKQHGFARDTEFALAASDETSCLWRLTESEATLAVWPYRFCLEIGYALTDDGIEVCWRVKNTGDERIAFTIGGHPAFLLGGAKEAFALELPGVETLHVRHLDPASGCCVSDKVELLPLKDGRLALNEEMFTRDALILDGGQVSEVRVLDAQGNVLSGMRCPDFPNYGIWSVAGAPFVCLEPWQGRCDDVGFAATPFEKGSATVLEPGEIFEKRYVIF